MTSVLVTPERLLCSLLDVIWNAPAISLAMLY